MKQTSRLRLKCKLKSVWKSNAFKTRNAGCVLLSNAKAKSQTRKSMKINVICTVQYIYRKIPHRTRKWQPSNTRDVFRPCLYRLLRARSIKTIIMQAQGELSKSCKQHYTRKLQLPEYVSYLPWYCRDVRVRASICANNTANQHNVFQSYFYTMMSNVNKCQKICDDNGYVCEWHVLANDTLKNILHANWGILRYMYCTCTMKSKI